MHIALGEGTPAVMHRRRIHVTSQPQRMPANEDAFHILCRIMHVEDESLLLFAAINQDLDPRISFHQIRHTDDRIDAARRRPPPTRRSRLHPSTPYRADIHNQPDRWSRGTAGGLSPWACRSLSSTWRPIHPESSSTHHPPWNRRLVPPFPRSPSSSVSLLVSCRESAYS